MCAYLRLHALLLWNVHEPLLALQRDSSFVWAGVARYYNVMNRALVALSLPRASDLKLQNSVLIPRSLQHPLPPSLIHKLVIHME